MMSENRAIQTRLTYDEAVNLFGRRLCAERRIDWSPDDTFTIEVESSYGCDTCGPDNAVTLYKRGRPRTYGDGIVKEWMFSELGDILREIWSVEE